MSVTIAAAVGLAAGLHAATWGVFKDAPHEGFHWSRFVRSPVIGLAAALVLVALLPWPPGAAGAVLLFGASYTVERFIIETWKTFFRAEDQSKYTIPMQLAVRGQPVRSAAVRAILGVIYFSGGFGVLAGVRWLGHGESDSWLLVALLGSAGGWISAFGGAWKDAPIEGFETFKFFRSPGVAFGYALLLSQLTPDPGIVMLAATGLTIASLETWKKFSRPNEPGGKFAGKPIPFPEMLRHRYRLVPLYAAITGGVALALVTAVLGSHTSACADCTASRSAISGRAP